MEREQLSIILNLVTALLFVISEVLGLSKCEANGIVHLFLKGMACLHKEEEVKEKPKTEFVPEPLMLQVQKPV